MRLYRSKAASVHRVEYGVELVAGLRRFAETLPLANSFELINDSLFKQYMARLSARKPLVAARVPLRIAEYEAGQVIRACANAAHEADGSKGGPLYKSLFKEGLKGAIRASGASRMLALKTLMSNLTASAAAGIDPFRTTWTPKLQTALNAFEAANATLGDRRNEYLHAFHEELALRNKHWVAVNALQGQVRTAFPDNKIKQNLVFPESDDDSEVTATPAPSPTPATPTKPAGQATSPSAGSAPVTPPGPIASPDPIGPSPM